MDGGDARSQAAGSKVRRDAVAIGVATGAYGLSFGAISTAAGLSVPQTTALSLLMFTGASQFALVGVVGGGGTPLAGAVSALLLGARNAFYGVRLSSLLDLRGTRRVVGAQLVIDESAAMAIGQPPPSGTARLAFWATGLAVFVLWNLGTVLGAVGARALSDPSVLGLDAAAPAAFVALVAPQVRGREPWAVALGAAAAAVAVTPVVPAGVPVLIAAATAVTVGLVRPAGSPA